METKAHEKICLNCMWLFKYDSRDRCRGCEQDHENFDVLPRERKTNDELFENMTIK